MFIVNLSQSVALRNGFHINFWLILMYTTSLSLYYDYIILIMNVNVYKCTYCYWGANYYHLGSSYISVVSNAPKLLE